MRQLHILRHDYSDLARLDFDVLAMHVLQCSKAYLYSHPDVVLTSEQEQRLQTLLDQRRDGLPVAYLTGHREFWSMDLLVTPATLIPRPETEGLVEACLTRVDRQAKCHILDLGTGTGAIALALARECPNWEILATDISPEALAVARENGQRLGLASIEWRLSDWFDAVGSRRFDVILSNPPYIAPEDPHLSQGDVRFEPRLALVSPEEGYADACHIIQYAPEYLKPGGWLLLEHGYEQAEHLRRAMQQAGFAEIETISDLQDHPRLTCAKIR